MERLIRGCTTALSLANCNDTCCTTRARPPASHPPTGTGSKYTIYNRTEKPSVYGPTTCMETDGQFFYSGVPWEITARDYVAEGINIAFNYTGSAKKTALDVIAVSAM